MIMIAEIINENGVLNSDAVESAFWEGMKLAAEMLFSNPKTVMILLAILLMGIISGIIGIAIEHKKARYWTKVKTRAMLEEKDKYIAEKKANNKKD